MGNIHYKGKVIDNLDATDIPDKSNVDRVAGILGVDLQALIDALTSKTIFAQGETVVSNCRSMIFDYVRINEGSQYLIPSIKLPFVIS